MRSQIQHKNKLMLSFVGFNPTCGYLVPKLNYVYSLTHYLHKLRLEQSTQVTHLQHSVDDFQTIDGILKSILSFSWSRFLVDLLAVNRWKKLRKF